MTTDMTETDIAHKEGLDHPTGVNTETTTATTEIEETTITAQEGAKTNRRESEADRGVHAKNLQDEKEMITAAAAAKGEKKSRKEEEVEVGPEVRVKNPSEMRAHQRRMSREKPQARR